MKEGRKNQIEATSTAYKVRFPTEAFSSFAFIRVNQCASVVPNLFSVADQCDYRTNVSSAGPVPLAAWRYPIVSPAEKRIPEPLSCTPAGCLGTEIVSTLPEKIVSCVVASAESVRIKRLTSAEFLIETPMQSTGATIAVHDTVSTTSCFLTQFGLEAIRVIQFPIGDWGKIL